MSSSKDNNPWDQLLDILKAYDTGLNDVAVAAPAMRYEKWNLIPGKAYGAHWAGRKKKRKNDVTANALYVPKDRMKPGQTMMAPEKMMMMSLDHKNPALVLAPTMFKGYKFQPGREVSQMTHKELRMELKNLNWLIDNAQNTTSPPVDQIRKLQDRLQQLKEFMTLKSDTEKLAEDWLIKRSWAYADDGSVIYKGAGPHKYTERTGMPGHYKYSYSEPGAPEAPTHTSAVSPQKKKKGEIDFDDPKARKRYMKKSIGVKRFSAPAKMDDDTKSKWEKQVCKSFHLLATILDLPPKFVSGNGRLSLKVNGRVKREVLAYYKPLDMSISLSADKGDGSLAHEWMHFLDHVLSDIHHGSSQKPWSAELNRPATFASIDKTMHQGGVFTELVQAIDEHMKPYLKRPAHVSPAHFRKYWMAPHEMLARAFEMYVGTKVQAATGESWSTLSGDVGFKSKQWHYQMNQEPIFKLFDEFFDVLKDHEFVEKAIRYFVKGFPTQGNTPPKLSPQGRQPAKNAAQGVDPRTGKKKYSYAKPKKGVKPGKKPQKPQGGGADEERPLKATPEVLAQAMGAKVESLKKLAHKVNEPKFVALIRKRYSDKVMAAGLSDVDLKDIHRDLTMPAHH